MVEYRILVAKSRDDLTKKVNAAIKERPYGLQELGSYIVVQNEQSLEYHQAIVKPTMEGVSTGIMNAETGVVVKKEMGE